MKPISYAILIIIVLTAGCAVSSTAQPVWDVNPYAFEFSMTITGKVTTDGTFSDDLNDRVAAFINGTCRGVANVAYENSVGEYFVYLMVYSNQPVNTISFKIYDAGKKEILNAKGSLNFAINSIVGSMESPLIFSSDKLKSEADLLSFTIPDQVGETTVSGRNVYLQKSPNSSLTGIISSFSVSEGAKVFVNSILQESGKTPNDFTKPLHFTVISADFSDTVVYTVYVLSRSNKPPVFVSNPANYVLQDEVYVYPVLVSDSDGDKISLILKELPPWLNFNPATGIITGVAHNEQVGTYNFKILTSDGFIESVQNVIIQVINKNDPPEIHTVFGNQVFYITKVNEIQIPTDCIIDPDVGDMLTFSLTLENNAALPLWLTFNSETLKIKGCPPDEALGIYYLKLTASDKSRLKEQIVFQLKVDKITATRERTINPGFRIYPNPFRNQLHMDVPEGQGNFHIAVYSVDGRLLHSRKQDAGSSCILNTTTMTPGIYFVKWQQGEKVEMTKMIKN